MLEDFVKKEEIRFIMSKAKKKFEDLEDFDTKIDDINKIYGKFTGHLGRAKTVFELKEIKILKGIVQKEKEKCLKNMEIETDELKKY